MLKGYLMNLSEISKQDLKLDESDLEFLSVINEKLLQRRTITTLAGDGGAGKTFFILEWAFKALSIGQINSQNALNPLFKSFFYFDLDGNQSALNYRKQVEKIQETKEIFYFDKTKILRKNKQAIKELESEINELKKSYEMNEQEINQKLEFLDCLKKWNSSKDKSAFFSLIAQSDLSLDGSLFVIDCLNSLVKDVKNDEQCANIYSVLDELKQRGVSIIVLAHTTKTRDANGEPIIAGSHEIRDGSDFLYLLISHPLKSESEMRLNLLEKKARNFRGVGFSTIGFKLDLTQPAGFRLEQCEPFTDLENIKGDEFQKIALKACEIIAKNPAQKVALSILYNATYEQLGGKIGKNKIQTAIKNELSKEQGLFYICEIEKKQGIKPAKIIALNPYAKQGEPNQPNEPAIYEFKE